MMNGTTDDEVFEDKTETEKKVAQCNDVVETVNQEVAPVTKDLNNDVVNGDAFAGEISPKNWAAATADDVGQWSTESPVIRFEPNRTYYSLKLIETHLSVFHTESVSSLLLFFRESYTSFKCEAFLRVLAR